MQLQDTILILSFAALSWPLWTVLHEASHVLVASLVAPIKDVEWLLYPHFDSKGNFYFARVKWVWDTNEKIPSEKLAAVLSAPRVMNLLAALATPLACLFPNPWSYVWAALWGGGLLDLLNGSIGCGEHTDLQRTSSLLNINPWWLRIAGFFACAASAAGLLACVICR